MTLKPFLSSIALVLVGAALSACGTDERITGVSQSAGEQDSGDGADNETDDDAPFGPSPSTGDDDTTGPEPVRPTPTPSSEPTLTSNIGMMCTSDASCGAGLECIVADSDRVFGGGPPHGICTMACGSDFDCLAVDSNGFCLPINDEEAVCVPACVPGDSLLGEEKCLGRPDLACASVQGYGFCVPMCGADDDCPEGRVCDVGFGTCVEGPLEGDPIGSACDPQEEENTSCQTGLCLGFTETYGACTGVCRTGTIGCGSNDQTPSDPGEPICLALFDGISLDGDIGQCIQRCNCDLDCDHPDAKCFAPFEDDADALDLFGTIGICINGDAAEDADEDARIGIECEDGREPPLMSEAGPVSSDAGNTSADSGAVSSPDASPEPSSPQVEAGPPAPDAAVSDGG